MSETGSRDNHTARGPWFSRQRNERLPSRYSLESFMSSTAPPIIAFELGVGEFRIVTPGAVYQIKVCHYLVEATK